MQRRTPAEDRWTQGHHTRFVVFFRLFFRRGRSCLDRSGGFGRRFGLCRRCRLWAVVNVGSGRRYRRSRRARSLRRSGLGRRFFAVVYGIAIRRGAIFDGMIFDGVIFDASPVRVRDRPWGIRLTLIVPAQLIGLIFVDRTGVGDLFGNPEFVQFVDDLARLHFQLPRQFIDANLTHNEAFRLTACYDFRQSTQTACGP